MIMRRDYISIFIMAIAAVSLMLLGALVNTGSGSSVARASGNPQCDVRVGWQGSFGLCGAGQHSRAHLECNVQQDNNGQNSDGSR
jgi:hypothetical protein